MSRRRTRKAPVEEVRSPQFPGFSADASVYRSEGRYNHAADIGTLAADSVIIPQQTVRFCLPCFWGRRRCCEYRHGGDLRCYSSRC
jgi:hypothetical protein